MLATGKKWKQIWWLSKSHRKKKKEIKQAKLGTFCSTPPEKAEGLQINSDSLWQNILWCLPAYG